MKKHLLTVSLCVLLMCGANVAFAKSVDGYDKPDATPGESVEHNWQERRHETQQRMENHNDEMRENTQQHLGGRPDNTPGESVEHNWQERRHETQQDMENHNEMRNNTQQRTNDQRSSSNWMIDNHQSHNDANWQTKESNWRNSNRSWEGQFERISGY